jgi:phosphoribosylformylglycinamidine synthase
MKSAVIVFPGSNCDRDAVTTLQKVGSKVTKIWHQETKIDDDLDLIVVPGGFSYGDYLRSGAMAAISPVMQEVKRLSKKGVKVLGICNGFQILTEAGLLEGVLLRNKKVKFICRDVLLRLEDSNTSFTSRYRKGQVVRFPIAHMDGNFFAETEVLKRLEGNGNVAFRYVDVNGNVTDDANPNGAALNIAGIFNDQKNVLGLMPHPERATDSNTGSVDGLLMFESLFN